MQRGHPDARGWEAMRMIVLAMLVALCGESDQARLRMVTSGGGGGFDTSAYRTNTYGAPTHYCDLTRSLASSGAGTLGDPWNGTQCQTQPVCGNRVGLLPVNEGAGGTPVDLPVAGKDYQEQAFHPSVTTCTSGTQLIYATKVAAITLVNLSSISSSTIATNGNRTEIRTDGVAESGGVCTTGRAVYGSFENHHVIYDGLFVDMAEAAICSDQGVISARSDVGVTITGVQFKNFVIKGAATTMDSNPVMYRPGGTLDTVLTNFAVYDFTNTGSQRALFSDQYGDRNYLIEKFLISNTERGIFPKGTATTESTTRFNYGTIQFGTLVSMESCFRYNDFDATNLSTLQYVLCQSPTAEGVALLNLTSAQRNLLVQYITVANTTCTANSPGPLYLKSAASTSNVTFSNNLFDYQNTAFCKGVYATETAIIATLNYNGYYRGAGTVNWNFNASNYTTIADWRTATSQEANSQVLASDPFTNRAGGVFTIIAGSAALTASSTGGQIGAYASGATLGPIQ